MSEAVIFYFATVSSFKRSSWVNHSSIDGFVADFAAAKRTTKRLVNVRAFFLLYILFFASVTKVIHLRTSAVVSEVM